MEHTVEQTARILGLTVERVRAEERRALRKLAAHPEWREVGEQLEGDSVTIQTARAEAIRRTSYGGSVTIFQAFAHDGRTLGFCTGFTGDEPLRWKDAAGRYVPVEIYREGARVRALEDLA